MYVPAPALPDSDDPVGEPHLLPTAAAAAAVNAGCPLEAEKLQPGGCYVASPYYADGAADCSDMWCGSPWAQPIGICEPVASVFEGGHHYRVDAGVVLDIFFSPYPAPSNPTPSKESFGWISVHYELGPLNGDPLAPPVVVDAYLQGQEAFDAGLDLVDGTLFGTLTLDPGAANVQGPVYHPTCEPTVDAVGREVPGPCACVFATAPVTIPVFVRLGPLPVTSPSEP